MSGILYRTALINRNHIVNIRLKLSKSFISSGKKAVIFDFGGVLIRSPVNFVQEFTVKYNLSREQTNKLLFDGGDSSLWGRLECGEFSVEGFGELFAERSKELFGKSLPDEIIMPISQWATTSTPLPEMITAIKQIRENGFQTALLTNNWTWIGGDNLPVDRSLFDVVVESYIEKIRKPNPLIYELVLKRLNVLPSEAVFIDDLGVNLKPASAMGITTIKCNDTRSTLQQLEKIIKLDLGLFIPGTEEVAEQHRLPVESLRNYLTNVLNLKDDGEPLVLRKFKHGQSNPTYYVKFGGEEMVLRKKPPGKLLPSAHAVEREYRVMKAVGEHGVPVPILYNLCEDSDVVGTPFYIMKYVSGHVFKHAQLPNMSPQDRTKIYSAMNKVLQKIHSVDLDKAGLHDYGKKGNYVLRTTKTWKKQYEASKTVEQPHMDKLADWLLKNSPHCEKDTVVHGDFRIDNLIFNDDLEVIAVLDWELSTTGDPLSDVSYNCLLHHLPSNFPVFSGLKDVDLQSLGIPSTHEYIEEYVQGMNVTGLPNMNPYMACTFYRFAAIFQGVYKRSLQGQASSPLASQLGSAVNILAKIGCSFIEEEKTIDCNGQIGNSTK